MRAHRRWCAPPLSRSRWRGTGRPSAQCRRPRARRLDGWVDGWTVYGWMDGCVHVCMNWVGFCLSVQPDRAPKNADWLGRGVKCRPLPKLKSKEPQGSSPDPPLPIATPICARFSAGASLTPSPVTATTSPRRCSCSTICSFCWGLVRANTISGCCVWGKGGEGAVDWWGL